jgi:hypothetical protein
VYRTYRVAAGDNENISHHTQARVVVRSPQKRISCINIYVAGLMYKISHNRRIPRKDLSLHHQRILLLLLLIVILQRPSEVFIRVCIHTHTHNLHTYTYIYIYSRYYNATCMPARRSEYRDNGPLAAPISCLFLPI